MKRILCCFTIAILTACGATDSSTTGDSPDATVTPWPTATPSRLDQLYEPLFALPTPIGRFVPTPTPNAEMLRLTQYRDLFYAYGIPFPPDLSIPTQRTEFGAQINGCDGPTESLVRLAKEIGFKWVKQQVRWGDLTNAAGLTNWGCVDRTVDLARQHGLKVMLSVTTAPAHLRFIPRVTGPPNRLRDWHDFVQALAQRYASRIDAVEVWNEPNLSAEWDEGPNPRRYGEMLTIAYLAVKRHAPHITVILGGLAPLPDSAPPRYISDLEFLDRLAQDKVGLLGYDCLGAHANGPPDFGYVPDVIRRYRDYYAQRPDYPRRPLCLTEFSYSMPIGGQAPPDFGWAIQNNEAEGAALFRLWLSEIDRSKMVALAFVFNLGYHDGITPNSIAALDRPGLSGQILAVIQSYLASR